MASPHLRGVVQLVRNISLGITVSPKLTYLTASDVEQLALKIQKLKCCECKSLFLFWNTTISKKNWEAASCQAGFRVDGLGFREDDGYS